jgi:HD-GYP domain-containing protein (c-di-GMP phosphodiesterase class II)
MKRRTAISVAQSAHTDILKEFAYLRRRVAHFERLEHEHRKWKQEIQNSNRQLRKAMDRMIQAISMTIEMRDPYTAGHQQRVTHLACSIADRMGLSKEKIEGIYMAAMIHDLGKIYIPAEILSKPGKLSDFEYLIIKMHPEAGHNILKIMDFPWPIAQMVFQHHERLNGSGYPKGICGNEIMLESRILAVADIVESMASHRPYRPAIGLESALEEITRYRDILYDPEVVDVCNQLILAEGFSFESGPGLQFSGFQRL